MYIKKIITKQKCLNKSEIYFSYSKKHVILKLYFLKIDKI